MKVVKRNGKLLAVAQHEDNKYFWESDLTEAIVFDDEKFKLEVTLMCDFWNEKYHEEFERLWEYLRYFFLTK